MLDLIGLLGLVAFVLASLVVGTRILLLARRTHGVPETLIGSSLVIAGGFGTGGAVLPALWTTLDPETAYVVFQLSSVASHVGYGLLFFFVWRVFRPNQTWAAALFFACVGVLAIGGVGLGASLQLGESISRPESDARHWLLVSLAARFVGYAWASIESFRYAAMLKRRLRIGLGDALTARRFTYWGVCTTAVVLIWANLAAEQLIPAVAEHPAVTQLVSALLGFVVAGSLSVAFFPRGAARAAESPADASGAAPTA